MGTGEGRKPYLPILLASSSAVFGLATTASYVFSPKSNRRLRNSIAHSGRGTLLHAAVISAEHSLAAVRGQTEVDRLDSFYGGALVGAISHGQPRVGSLISALFLGSVYYFFSPSHRALRNRAWAQARKQ